MGDRYNVPVFGSEAAMLEAFPPQDIDNLLPKIPENQWATILRFVGANFVAYSVLKDPMGDGAVLVGDSGARIMLPPTEAIFIETADGSQVSFDPGGLVSMTHPRKREDIRAWGKDFLA